MNLKLVIYSYFIIFFLLYISCFYVTQIILNIWCYKIGTNYSCKNNSSSPDKNFKNFVYKKPKNMVFNSGVLCSVKDKTILRSFWLLFKQSFLILIVKIEKFKKVTMQCGWMYLPSISSISLDSALV